ncbi:hypothetical protein LZ30DRAFT_279975 [Colletotrichum cereale]|nr:hypothetical protein LZ30DRAFT_279975 [Colletotrichum cereale]
MVLRRIHHQGFGFSQFRNLSGGGAQEPKDPDPVRLTSLVIPSLKVCCPNRRCVLGGRGPDARTYSNRTQLNGLPRPSRTASGRLLPGCDEARPHLPEGFQRVDPRETKTRNGCTAIGEVQDGGTGRAEAKGHDCLASAPGLARWKVGIARRVVSMRGEA